jgi:hypothetical protein
MWVDARSATKSDSATENGCGLICYHRAVHDPLPPFECGGQRSVSRRKVLQYACSAPVLLSLGTLAATLDGQRASAANIRLIDFAERTILPDQIKSAGYAGIVAYIPRRGLAQTSRLSPSAASMRMRYAQLALKS